MAAFPLPQSKLNRTLFFLVNRPRLILLAGDLALVGIAMRRARADWLRPHAFSDRTDRV